MAHLCGQGKRQEWLQRTGRGGGTPRSAASPAAPTECMLPTGCKKPAFSGLMERPNCRLASAVLAQPHGRMHGLAALQDGGAGADPNRVGGPVNHLLSDGGMSTMIGGAKGVDHALVGDNTAGKAGSKPGWRSVAAGLPAGRQRRRCPPAAPPQANCRCHAPLISQPFMGPPALPSAGRGRPPALALVHLATCLCRPPPPHPHPHPLPAPPARPACASLCRLQVRNLQRMQARTEVTTDRALIGAFKEIGKICAAMKLLDTVKKQAEEYYKQVGAARCALAALSAPGREAASPPSGTAVCPDHQTGLSGVRSAKCYLRRLPGVHGARQCRGACTCKPSLACFPPG